ncbi:hypothetical protein M3484_17395 [Pseudomonas sp. GX19020]|uniref:hypothetical protein n=1 Tax=Pseudomonas sp. GX19020 TaxID=2942277 RepID=UPI002019996C|nr:hypothetical protein [Pseudomonas sp. GX19020]MCL4068344.1 hypothetical protein [Pseudomonas sp. GX19020]
MAQNIGKLTISPKEVLQGITLSVRMPRSFTIRTRIACWLLGLAGRVMDVRCEIEMLDDGSIRPGDVVVLRARPRNLCCPMTVRSVDDDEATCDWFQGDRHFRETFPLGMLTLVEQEARPTFIARGYQAVPGQPGPVPRGGSAVIPCNYTPTVGKAPDSPSPMPSKK